MCVSIDFLCLSRRKPHINVHRNKRTEIRSVHFNSFWEEQEDLEVCVVSQNDYNWLWTTVLFDFCILCSGAWSAAILCLFPTAIIIAWSFTLFASRNSSDASKCLLIDRFWLWAVGKLGACLQFASEHPFFSKVHCSSYKKIFIHDSFGYYSILIYLVSEFVFPDNLNFLIATCRNTCYFT